MKRAWEELTSDPDQEIYTTFRSRWYVEHGVKIERFHDGTIEVKNVMRNGDHYTDITPMQRSYFTDYGWFAGAYKVCVDEFERQVDSAKFLMDTAKDRDWETNHSQ